MSVTGSIFGRVRTGVRFYLLELPPGPGFAARRGWVSKYHHMITVTGVDSTPAPVTGLCAGGSRKVGVLSTPAFCRSTRRDLHMVGKFTRRPALDLLHCAQESLQEAVVAHTPHERYSAAHLAALRVAAAVLAARAQVTPGPRRQRIRSAWDVLTEVAPELGEWAAFFAAGAKKRASAQAGIPCVTAREADDLVRDSQRFLYEVAASLDVLAQGRLLFETSPSDSRLQLLRVG